MTSASSFAPKKILMVAFHFPPATGSSGYLRTLSFVRELPRHGWQPIVLTATKTAYPSEASDSKAEVPDGVPIHRALALDAARHLSFNGRYFRHLALPDRWANWVLAAVPLGLALIARHRPRVLWTTYPIASAHLIGLTLHKLTGIPWVADFRDPMIEVDPYTGQRYPADPHLWDARSWIESHVLKNCSRSVFVSPGALKICRERYEGVRPEVFSLVPNGYNEESFVQAENKVAGEFKRCESAILLHSGLLYPTPDRDPKHFFSALAELKREGVISASSLRIVLRASGYDERYRKQISELGIQDVVRLEPPKPYVDALAEMLTADGLLVFQGYTSNPAVPAKLYEYLRARRPIIALVHEDGDTAATLRAEGVGCIMPLDSPEMIVEGLKRFLSRLREGSAPVLSPEAVRKHSRSARAAELAALLEEIAH
jgi:glycosyltransferase involved in cell wall biosynthesis